MTENRALTIFQGRVGDHNDRAMPGAGALGQAWARRLALAPILVGVERPATNGNWGAELESALPILRVMSRRYEEIYAADQIPVSAITRCAVALSTLPVVARHHPDAVVLWLDAHADLNTPQRSASGYLGGLALSGPLGLWDSGLGAGLSAANAVLLGTRDLDPYEQRLVDDGVVSLIPVGADLLETVDRLIGDRPVYFHLDCDVLEPGTVPTDYRVPGGLSLQDLHGITTRLAENPLVGIEVGEFEVDSVTGTTDGRLEDLLDALAPLVEFAV